jgi:folate-binding protein YgfZ
MSNPFLEFSGAVEADGVPLHFGAPLVEQRALESGDAVVSLGHHGVVTVAGADRLSWLHTMTSQHLANLRPNEPVETLLLSPQGRIEQAIRLVDDGERCWLIVDSGAADSLTNYLLRMRFSLRVEIENVSERYAVVAAFEGGPAAQVLRERHLAVIEWCDPWATVAVGGVQYSSDAHTVTEWSAVHFVCARAELATIVELAQSGVLRLAGTTALDALEVRAHRPSFRGEVDERAIPHELDWLRTAVHMDKGCYRGQETVAKVHNLGHPPRRLALLHLEGSGGELPTDGALVYLADSDEEAKPVGRTTRVALHHEWGGIALALLKRSVSADAALEVALNDSGARIAAVQEVIVPAEAGATRRRPPTARITPRRE